MLTKPFLKDVIKNGCDHIDCDNCPFLNKKSYECIPVDEVEELDDSLRIRVSRYATKKLNELNKIDEWKKLNEQ